MVPVRSKLAAACAAPVRVKRSWWERTAWLAAWSTAGSQGSATWSGWRRRRSSSSCVVPQIPHDDEVVVRRGVGSGARPPVSTLTTLNSVSDAGPVPQ